MGLPSNDIKVIWFFESCLAHCMSLIWPAAVVNDSKKLRYMKSFKINKKPISYNDAIAIGACLLANLFNEEFIEINITGSCYFVRRDSIKCPLCEITLAKVCSFQYHLFHIHKITDNEQIAKLIDSLTLMKCPNAVRGCTTTFRSLGHMEFHEKEYCKFAEKHVKCTNKNCSQRVLKEDLLAHVETCKYLPKNAKGKPCKHECGAFFTNDNSLKDHETYQCTMIPKPDLPCPRCKKFLKGKKKLSLHRIYCREKYTCGRCRKTFVAKSYSENQKHNRLCGGSKKKMKDPK